MSHQEYQARQVLRDAAMRRALLEFLQEKAPDYWSTKPGGKSWPEPMRDDEDVQDEINRILGIKRGLFR